MLFYDIKLGGLMSEGIFTSVLNVRNTITQIKPPLHLQILIELEFW